MRPPRANFINGLILVILGVWNYFSSNEVSSLALIPPVTGLVFIASTPILQKGNKTIYFVIMSFTVLLTLTLLYPLISQFRSRPMVEVSRTATMFFSGIVATVVFIKYYLDNRWRWEKS